MPTNDHIFVPSAKWLVGLVGALLLCLASLAGYVWNHSQDARDKELERLETRIGSAETKLVNLQIYLVQYCPAAATALRASAPAPANVPQTTP